MFGVAIFFNANGFGFVFWLFLVHKVSCCNLIENEGDEINPETKDDHERSAQNKLDVDGHLAPLSFRLFFKGFILG